MKTMSRHRLVFKMSRHEVDVATWLGRSGGRDTDLMSRHVSGYLDVATSKRGRDLGCLTGQGREVATCAHDLGTMRAACAR